MNLRREESSEGLDREVDLRNIGISSIHVKKHVRLRRLEHLPSISYACIDSYDRTHPEANDREF